MLAAVAATPASDVPGRRTLDGHSAGHDVVDAKAEKAFKSSKANGGAKAAKSAKVYKVKSSKAAAGGEEPVPSPPSPPCDSRDRGSFLDFAETTLQGQIDAVCSNSELAEVCAGIRDLEAAGEKYASLPRWYRLNWKAMTLAYPAIGLMTSGSLPLDGLRVHMSLGLGNSLRLQGYPEDDVNKAYWSHWDVLSVQDGNLQDRLSGIEQYCKYTASEYETLKSFAVESFGTDYSLVQAFFGPFTDVKEGPFYQTCVGGTDIGSWLVRNDWEHHRREVIGSLMDGNVTEAIVTYAVWHWESLWAMVLAPDLTVPTLMNSFDVLLDTFPLGRLREIASTH